MMDITFATVSVTKVSGLQVTDGMATFTLVSVTTYQYLMILLNGIPIRTQLIGVESEVTCEALIRRPRFV